MHETRPVLEAAARHALNHLESLAGAPIGPTVDFATLRHRLEKPLAEAGLPAAQVIDELVRDVEGGIIGSAGGRFFAWVMGGALPSAMAADWLTTAWDQNAAMCSSGPAAAVIEEIAGAWLKQILGLPERSSFAFVTGCQMAHVTCLSAARHFLLAARDWNVEEQGLPGAPEIRILAGEQRHPSFDRAVRFLGFGTAKVEHLPADSEGRLAADALAAALDKNPSAPTIVLLQAGEINIGSYDSFATLIPLIRRHHAWVHVDGAFGLWAAASPRLRHLVEGVELADSWATDGHKWLNVPFDSGYAFIAHSEAHRGAMSISASYLRHDPTVRDQIDWNPDWSRRARGFSTYAALRELGRTGVTELIERCSDHARAIVTGIGRLPGAEVLWEPVINQGLVRFLDPKGQDHDRRTDDVIAAIVKTGEAFFGGTTWRGMRAMRVSVCNWRTSEQDVQRTIDAVAKVLSLVP
jgi:glutamate/tyrosine decarboxylase-like PLP-dependent enzyme